MRLGARHTEVVGDGLIEPIVTPLGFPNELEEPAEQSFPIHNCLFRWKILL